MLGYKFKYIESRLIEPGGTSDRMLTKNDKRYYVKWVIIDPEGKWIADGETYGYYLPDYDQWNPDTRTGLRSAFGEQIAEMDAKRRAMETAMDTLREIIGFK